jgi:hypothetical protein
MNNSTQLKELTCIEKKKNQKTVENTLNIPQF